MSAPSGNAITAPRSYPRGRGGRLSYRVIGSEPDGAAGRTFAYLPGLGSSSAGLPAMLVPPGTSVIAIDRPGYAASTTARYTPADFVDDAARLLRSLGVESAHVVGWSAGGLYAEHFSRRHPDLVASLSRVSSAPPFTAENGPDPELPEYWARMRQQLSTHPRRSRLDFALSGLAALSPARALKRWGRGSAADAELFADPRFRPNLLEAVREGWAHLGRGVFPDAVAMMSPLDTTPREAPHPVYLWHGDADAIFPLSTVSANEALYRRASVTLLPDEGHFAYLRAWPDIIRTALGE